MTGPVKKVRFTNHPLLKLVQHCSKKIQNISFITYKLYDEAVILLSNLLGYKNTQKVVYIFMAYLQTLIKKCFWEVNFRFDYNISMLKMYNHYNL